MCAVQLAWNCLDGTRWRLPVGPGFQGGQSRNQGQPGLDLRGLPEVARGAEKLDVFGEDAGSALRIGQVVVLAGC